MRDRCDELRHHRAECGETRILLWNERFYIGRSSRDQCAVVKGLERMQQRIGGRERVTDQRGKSLVVAQHAHVLDAVASGRHEQHERRHELELGEPRGALTDRQRRSALFHAETLHQLDEQR